MHAVFDSGWVDYSPSVDAIVDLLYRLGVVFDFGWGGWEGKEAYRNGAGLDSAPIIDVARVATVVLRGEHFSDGSLADAIENGTFAAMLRRLRQWRNAI